MTYLTALLFWIIFSALDVLLAAEAAVPAAPVVQEILREPHIENAYPRWSRDGAQVLYQSNRSGTWQIYVMNADGSDNHQITTDSSNNNFPDWAPDNSRVAFVSDRSGNEEVYVMNMDGSGLTNLSKNDARDIHPYWTPDGKRILFNSSRDDASSFEVYIVNADGSGLERITNTPDVETCARMSPDGKSILFLNGDAVTMSDDVGIMNADGSHRINLTRTMEPDGWPTWSTDGKRIIYSATGPDGRYCLFSMKADGTEKRQITQPPAPYIDARASVGPDSSSIVFNRQKGDGTISIHTVKAAN